MHTDVIPGTVHLVDLAGTLHVKHNEGGQKDIVLLPQPTNEYDDPLNWSKGRKLLCACLLLLAVFSADIMTTLLSAAEVDMSAETGIPISTLNQGISVQYFFFGWSNWLLWQPMGLTFGRRPCLLAGALGMIACSVWTSYVTSTGEWYANRIIIGFMYGPIETMIEVCMSDVFFAHDRGFWIGMYCWILFGIPFLGAVPAGYIAQYLGWKWIQWVAAIISAGCTLIMFFFLEETMFYRPPIQEEALDVVEESASDEGFTGTTTEKQTVTSQSPQTEVGMTSTKKSFAQKLKFWGARRPGQPNNYLRHMWMPFALLRFPVITFAGILVGSVLSWFNVVVDTIALVLAAEPYNMSTDAIGLMFLAPFIGCTIGCLFAGVAANKFAVWMSRRKGGIFEPEYRLWMAVVPFVLHPAGCILFGVGAKQGVSWVGIAFGLAFIVGTFPIGSAIAINYIIDSYKEVSGDGLVTMICIRNTMGFGFGFAVTPWITADGVQNTYIAIGFIGMFFWGLCFLFILIGKKTRKATAKAYWTMVEEHGLQAH
ncbi:major facilitator superfamily domain-containing protein [Exophiala viscosa]|uniref:Major facilitator superfamily domain-containing protein n=2 Tax=Exophiala viscosa TaxID=2486360 RepID=A0AAN6ID42_9EURO|nr:major facilitator superfamily domain-containing protein [Exophiala viscosa]